MNIPEPVYIVLFLTFSGLIIRTCLVIVGQSWSKTYHYLGTYILLPNIAYVVTTVIANNIHNARSCKTNSIRFFDK